jgi:gamma-tubulin complex component 5
MRHLVQSIYTSQETNSTIGTISRTLEAFAESIQAFIHEVDVWCAEQDEIIVRSRGGVGRPAVVSLLSTHFVLMERLASTPEVIQDILRKLVKQELGKSTRTHHHAALEKMGFLRASAFTSLPPHLLSNRLLDLLLQAVNTQLAIGDLSTASKLTEIFTRTAEPVWSGIERWLRNGIPVSVRPENEENDEEEEMDSELFIRRRHIDLVNPDFWENGYTLRCEGDDDDGEEEDRSMLGSRTSLVPSIFVPIAADILAAGKAVGLLRAIGIASFSDDTNRLDWMTFSKLYDKCRDSLSLDSTDQDDDMSNADDTYGNRLVIDSLGAALFDCVSPWCSAAQESLTRLLLEECEMMEHFAGIENFFLMKRGDAMGAFCDQVFAKVSLPYNPSIVTDQCSI